MICETNGNISATARNLGISRSRCKARIDKNPSLVALVEDLTGGVIDQAKENVFNGVMRGDPTDSRFVLQTIGGFSTKVAGSGKDGEIVVVINKLGGSDAVDPE